jgi:hypothetical protein
MRLAVLVASLAALIATPASAAQWNAYTPCDQLELAAWQKEEYRIWGYCEPDRLTAFHRMVGAPALARVARSGRAVRVIAIEGRLYARPPHYRLVVIDVVERGDRGAAAVRGQGRPGDHPFMHTRVSPADWSYIAEGAARLANLRAVSPTSDDCIHAMEIIVETHGFGEPRTLVRDWCSADGETFAYGHRILEQVLETARECRRTRGWIVDRLKECVEGPAR